MESEIAKWRATAHTVWRVECPKVANTTIAFVEVVRLNCQLSSKVGGVLAKLLCTRLDCDELFRCYKDLQVEKKELVGKVEGIAEEKDKLAKVVVDLKAQLKESKSRLEESELRVVRERKSSKELKEELLVYKKEAMEQYEKRFHKAVRKVGFFVKDLDLGLFDPFKDVKDGVLLDEEEIAGEKGIVNEEQGVE